jgi:outer membrane protein assembly factor BamA
MYRALLAALAAVLMSGCAARLARPIDDRPIVRKIAIDGNSRANPASEIKKVLRQRGTSFLHFTPLSPLFPRYYLEGLDWHDDRTRIANWYALRGYLDARVLGSQLQPWGRKRPDGSREFVNIVHQVEEGDPSLVRAVNLRFEGPTGRDDPAELRRSITKKFAVVAGETFRMSSVEAAKRSIKRILQNRGHARVSVEHVIDAYPEAEAVDVHFVVQPGPTAVFGEVSLDGLEDDLRRFVLRHIRIEPGTPFSADAIRKTQQGIYGMGLFALVTVTPELSGGHDRNDAGEERIPVRIVLQESKPGTREFGFGVGFQVGQINTYGSVDVKHLNLFRRLVRAELAARAGFRFLSESDFGPLLNVRPEILIPDFPARTLTFHTGVEFDLGVEVAYWLGSVEFDIGLTWAPVNPFKFDVSFEVGYFDLFNDDRLAALDAVVAELGFTDQYLLYTIRQSAILDLRDQPLRASKGLYLGLGAQQSGLASGFAFIRLDGDLRGYVPLGTPHAVLALRANASGIIQLDPDVDVPISERIFAGGDGSVRGWRLKYASPRVQDTNCIDQDRRRDCIVPIGGNFGLSGTVELRGNPWGGLWIAGFVDFGRAWSRLSDVAISELFDPTTGLQLGIGGGVRFDTVVGRLRLDLAAHPHDWTDPVFRKSRFWNNKWREAPVLSLHFGIGESF